MSRTDDLSFDRGLPVNLDAERFVLGAIMLHPGTYVSVAGNLDGADFSIEANRRIYGAMSELYERGEEIDRITVADALMRKNQLESVGGLGYLVSLDDGLPQLHNVESYVEIVREKALLRRYILTTQQMTNRAFVAEESAEEQIEAAEEALLRLKDGRVRKTLLSAGEIIEQYEGGINAFLDPSKRRRGLGTGFGKLDEMTGGFREGELIVLAARPSMGKTALAMNIAAHAALKSADQGTVAVFSLEMSREQLLMRLVCSEARVNIKRVQNGYVDQDERRRLMTAMSRLVEAPILIDDSASASLVDMHAKLRRIKSERGLSMVIIDYLQLMSGRGRVENRVQEVSQLTRGMKILAKEMGVPFIVLSQLNRAPDNRPGDHRPTLSDLRESGSIEQDADIVMFVFREEYYKREVESLRGQAELIIGKQRNGPTGKVELLFRHEFTRFENRTSDFDEAQGEEETGRTLFE